MNKIIFAVSALTVLAGCSSTDNDKLANNDGYRCEQVRELGSSIPRRVCTTRLQREEAKAEAREQLKAGQLVLTGDDRSGG